MRTVKNAIIEDVTIDMGDRNLLTVWLHLDYGDGLYQGFGGYSLYLSKAYRHHGECQQHNYAGHFIYRCMEIAGVENWKDIKGKSIRVESEGENGFSSKIVAIGHICKDDWFNPSEDFNKMKGQ